MSSVQKALEHDCSLMFEGIRRLIEGTCCLEGEEKLCVWNLFDRLYCAFMEHVEFEEKYVLPKLEELQRIRHEGEHLRLRGLVEKARWEFECAQGDSFRRILVELAAELKAHHERDPGFDKADGHSRDRNFLRIAQRAGQDVLS